MIWESMVGPAQTAAPKGCWFSGEMDGLVTSQRWVGSSTRRVEEELGRAAQDRIDLLQIFLVAAELVVIPQMYA